jgi:hypothetical protein
MNKAMLTIFSVKVTQQIISDISDEHAGTRVESG